MIVMNLPKKNLSLPDRLIRGLISIALLVFAIFGSEQIGDIILQVFIVIFAGLNLISFTIGWCPIYKLANISTFTE